MDRRHKNVDWRLQPARLDNTVDNNTATHALLMDVRDELQRLNSLLHCPNFVEIPEILRKISRNTTPKRKPAKKRVS